MRKFVSVKPLVPYSREKPLSFRSVSAVPQTDTGGRAEDAKALGSTRVKELGKIVP